MLNIDEVEIGDIVTHRGSAATAVVTQIEYLCETHMKCCWQSIEKDSPICSEEGTEIEEVINCQLVRTGFFTVSSDFGDSCVAHAIEIDN